MPSCLVYFGTSEGQTRKIARVLADRLEDRGIAVELVEAPQHVDPAAFDAVVVGDSIHVGHYHRKVVSFIRKHLDVLQSKPSAFFSVCLGASSEHEEDRQRAQDTLDQMLEKTGWDPQAAVVVAGALQYTKYGRLTRWVMKKIATAEGLATDTSRDHEYTDWHAVEELAATVADGLLGGDARPRSDPAAG